VFIIDDEEIVLRQRDEFEIDLLSHVRGRVGWAGWHPNVLLFAAGGLSIADASVDSRRDFGLFDHKGEDDQTFFGWTVGGGIDWMITPHLVVRAEYLFDRFEDEEFKFRNRKIDAEVDQLHTVRGALIWKF
jgi:outer membrane immunogenic protein